IQERPLFAFPRFRARFASRVSLSTLRATIGRAIRPSYRRFGILYLRYIPLGSICPAICSGHCTPQRPRRESKNSRTVLGPESTVISFLTSH
ncbi:hypothetical protein PMAYCL1PPCAC_08570, partial [Pristionchus mayeri]